MQASYRTILITTCTMGIFAFVYKLIINRYYFFWKKNTKKGDDDINKKNKENIPKKDSLKIILPKTLEVTTCVSLEVTKKNIVSPRTNDVSLRLIPKIGEKSFKESTSPRMQHNPESPKKSVKTPGKPRRLNDYSCIEEEKYALNNSTNDVNVDKTTPRYDSKQFNDFIQKKLQTLNRSNIQADTTLLNIISDLKNADDLDPEIKRKIQSNIENQMSLILDKPEIIAGDIMHESEGYLEEDDVNSKEYFENVSEGFFDSEERPNGLKVEDTNSDDIIIRNITELRMALQEKNRNRKYKLEFEEKFYVFQEKNSHQIIKAEEFIYILKHLYNDLHSKLVEMNDTFDEERRRYFQKDERTYISIISYHLQKKEEFFLIVISSLMGRLSISQEILDGTFYYYFHLCDQSLPYIKQIKENYEEVYQAGLKYSIAPKNLTKKVLKKIYLFQLNLYEKLNKKHSGRNDIVDVMIIDHVYAEYGLDNECIKAAEKKFNIKEDPEFIPIFQKMSQFQNNSFMI